MERAWTDGRELTLLLVGGQPTVLVTVTVTVTVTVRSRALSQQTDRVPLSRILH